MVDSNVNGTDNLIFCAWLAAGIAVEIMSSKWSVYLALRTLGSR